jgi:hypothetical protein
MYLVTSTNLECVHRAEVPDLASAHRVAEILPRTPGVVVSLELVPDGRDAYRGGPQEEEG